jgi:3-oxoacyl-[acyl-carrier protein] reductase
MVESFAQQGATVFAHARKETPEFTAYLQGLSEKYQVKITPFYCEMTDSAQIKAAVKALAKLSPSFDVLINNVGVAHGGLFQMTTIDEIRRVFEINLFSIMEFTQLISRFMIRQKSGSIVNISSISGLDLHSGNSAYGTSKAALIAFTQVLSKELASFGIRVNAIAPGLTDTDMATLMEKKAGEAMVSESAMNRLGKPEETAQLALFLASDKASFISGQVIRCDGGKK